MCLYCVSLLVRKKTLVDFFNDHRDHFIIAWNCIQAIKKNPLFESCRQFSDISLIYFLTCFAAVNSEVIFLTDQSLGQPCSATNHLAGVEHQFGWGGGRRWAVGTADFRGLCDSFNQNGGCLMEAVSPWQPYAWKRGEDDKLFLKLPWFGYCITHSVLTEIQWKHRSRCSWEPFTSTQKREKVSSIE